ncbi:MAG TPA: hypothetical protein DHW82_09260 [Spirochaetia bacterium]|nr:MAG: hypothetical protein A2Y41_08760 [Spirochaetes bacterium GWB1_36_13]HCL57178.1 hypothetical protein [Spirochaetia bacterium]
MEYDIVREANKVIIIFNENELFDSFMDNAYTNMMYEVAEEGKDIELDFSNVDIIDSLFIGGMIVLYKKLEASDRKLIISKINKNLQDIFEKMNMKQMLHQK